MVLAEALGIEGNHPNLIELNLSFNEIKVNGAGSIADAMRDKENLESLLLDGNAFGEEGRAILTESLKCYDRIESLGSLDEDEDDNDEESDEEDEDEDDSEKEEDDEEDYEQDDDYYENDEPEEIDDDDDEQNSIIEKKEMKVVSVQDFLKEPSSENFLLLQGDKCQIFLDYVKVIITITVLKKLVKNNYLNSKFKNNLNNKYNYLF